MEARQCAQAPSSIQTRRSAGGRFGLELDPELIGEYHPDCELAPTQPALAARADARCRRTMAFLRWDLEPYWSRGGDQRCRMINARADTVADKPDYRAAFWERRCLIQTEGF